MGEIILDINYSGENSEIVLGMYIDTHLAEDISQVGWNICDCDDEKFARLVGDCVVRSSNIENGKAIIEVQLDGTDVKLIEKTLQDYLAGFDYFIRPIQLELSSRTSENYDFMLKEAFFELIKSL